MRKVLIVLMIVALAGFAAPTTDPLTGQTLFKDAVKDKYELRTVSCFACHERVERGVDNPKQFRNDLGKIFEKEFEGSDVTARLAAVEELDKEDPERLQVEEEVRKEFHAILERVEAMEHDEFGTYKEGMSKGLIDGFTPPRIR